MPLSTKLYCGGQFYWWRKPEYLENTTNLSRITDKLYYKEEILYRKCWEIVLSILIEAIETLFLEKL